MFLPHLEELQIALTQFMETIWSINPGLTVKPISQIRMNCVGKASGTVYKLLRNTECISKMGAMGPHGHQGQATKAPGSPQACPPPGVRAWRKTVPRGPVWAHHPASWGFGLCCEGLAVMQVPWAPALFKPAATQSCSPPPSPGPHETPC